VRVKRAANEGARTFFASVMNGMEVFSAAACTRVVGATKPRTIVSNSGSSSSWWSSSIYKLGGHDISMDGIPCQIVWSLGGLGMVFLKGVFEVVLSFSV
jgi:hypothetical protein